MTKKITPNFLRHVFVLIIFLKSFTLLSQNVDVTITVDWNEWSRENKVELYSPSSVLIYTIEHPDGYSGGSAGDVYDATLPSTPLNLPINDNLPANTGYYVILYDSYGDGWNNAGNLSITIDGVANAYTFNGQFSTSGTNTEITQTEYFAINEALNLDDASFSYANSNYSRTDANPTPTVTGEAGGTFSATSGLDINPNTGAINLLNSEVGSYVVTYTTTEPGQNSAQRNIEVTFTESQYHDNSKKYIEYIPGTIPVIISAPHGGVLQSGKSFGGVFYSDDNSLPDRSCGTNEQDDNTDVVIKEIQKRCFEQFGEYPYIIVSNLHRSKLDPNRNKSVATCNNSAVEPYFDAYHNFIDQASADVTAKFGKGLYIDLHGQSHSIPRVEAGYNLYSSSYDEDLNNTATNAVELSRVTIKNLIQNNLQNLSFEDLIRGSQSFGGLLQTTGGSEYASLGHAGCNRTEGYRTVPSHISSGNSQGSCDDTNPGNNAYFAGDYYSNIRHGSGDPSQAHAVVQGGGLVNGGGGTIDGIMTEVNRRVRDMGNLLTSYDGRQDTRSSTIPYFARDYAKVIEQYIDLHYNNFSNFNYTSTTYDVSDTDPTPTISGISGGNFSSTSGLSINANTGIIDLSNSTPGNYIISYNAPNITNYYKKTFNITITGTVLDNADFSYAIDVVCANDSNISPVITGEENGTFSSSFGLDINTTSGVINVSNSVPGNYIVTYTTENPGSNSATDTITINQNPTLTITNPTAVCAGTTVDLTANAITSGSSAGTLAYFSDANATSTLANANAISESGTYYIKLTNTNGCETVEAVNVTVNTNPTLTITNPAAVCSGATVDLTANAITAGSSAGTLAYFSDANTTASLEMPNAISTSGTYYIKLTNTNGCETVEAVNVTVNTNPTLSITNPTAVCSGATVDLTANAITTGSSNGTLAYFSDANATATLANANAISTSGTYYIKLTNTNGCETVETVNVTVNTNPTLTITNPAAVCSGETVDLTANAITTGSSNGTLAYFSDANANATLANANAISESGTYYIKLTNTNGCETVQAVNVTVNTNPTLTITNPTAVCAGATVDLTANAITSGSSAGTLAYFSDANVTSTLANANTISTSGTYYIKLTNTNGCETVKAVNVTVNENPTLTITNPAAVCSGETVDLTANAITSGSSAGTLAYFSDANATSTLVNANAISESGTYYIKLTNTNGCETVETVNVTVNTNPTLTITNPAAVCSGETVDLTANAITAGSSAGTLAYFSDANTTASLEMPNAISTSGTYYIKLTNTNGCETVEAVNVTVNANPTLSITNPTAVCAGATVDLTANAITAGSSTGTLTYFSDANATSTLANANAISESGTYYIKLTNTNGCETVQAVNVTVNTNPTLSITNPAAVCAGTTVDLTANSITAGSSTGTLTYFSDANAASTLANANAISTSGTYYIKLTNTNGCETVEAVNVTVNTNPTLTITNPDAVCSGETVDLTANAITAGSSNGTLTYFSDANATASLEMPDSIATSGTYYIKLTNTNGCETVEAVNVTVNTNPILTITNPAAVCTGATVDLTTNATTAGSSAGTLAYFSDANATSTLANANAVSESGTYYIKLTNTNGCETVQVVNVTVNTNPTLSITNPDAVCTGINVDLTANAITAGSSAGTLAYFSDANATSTLANANAVSESGTYYIKLTNTNGCETVKAVNVTVNENPTLTITNPAAVCSGETVDLTANAITTGSSAGTLAYFSDANATSTLANANAISTSGTYYIKLTNTNGCETVEAVNVTVNTSPTLTITNPTAVCSGETLDLTANAITAGSSEGTLAYFSDANATASLEMPNAISTSGTYYIKLTNTNGCETVQAVNVTVNANPTLTITNPAAVCSGETVDLTANAITAGSSAGTLAYFSDANATSTLANANAISESGTYYIKLTNTNGCETVEAVNVTVNTNPTLSITNPAAVCSGATVDLTANAITTGSSAGTLAYFSDANATSTLANSNAITTSGTYYIKLTNTNGCETVQAVNVTVNTNPTLSITNPAAVCSGETVDLTANAITTGSSAGTLAYFSDANATSTLANANAISTSGTYYIKLTNTNGCETVQAVNVTVNANPTLTITNPAAVCSGETVDLTANAITAGSSAGTLAYFSDANATATLANANAISESGKYYIKLTNTNGCETVEAVNVTVNTNPTLTITNPDAVCSGETVDLTANAITAGSSEGTLAYFSDANATSTLANANAISESGTYYIKLTNTNGCETVEAVNVTVNTNPTLTITNPAAVCSGETVDLTANAITSGSSAGTLAYFSDANATASLEMPNSIATSGTYYIKLTNTNGCETVEAVNVTVNTNPTFTSILPLNGSTNIDIDSNLTITFSEHILASTGNIVIKKVTDNTIVETIQSSTTTINNNQVTINPTLDLELNTSYFVEISNTAFTTAKGCSFIGISGNSIWNFTTIKNQTNNFLPINGVWVLDTNWSLGRTPIATDNVIISSGKTANFNLKNSIVNNLEVSGEFNIIKNSSLTIHKDVTNTGIFTINSGASLIVEGNAIGTYIYKRTLDANKWYLVGSPVSGQTVVDFINTNSDISRGSGSGDNQNIAFAPYNNTTNISNQKWSYYKDGQIDGENGDDTNDIIESGKGYTIRLSSPGDVTFTGNIETNTMQKTATKAISAFNLIANPFTSYLNSANFLSNNNGAGKSLTTQTLWIWNATLNNGLGAYETKITLSDFKIAPGQAFFVEVENDLGVNFQKSAQSHENTDSFLKTNRPEIKINISNGTKHKDATIYFIKGTSNGFDNGFDGEVFNGVDSNFEVYTKLVDGEGSKKLSIQSLPNHNLENVIIPIGLKANVGEKVTFSSIYKNIPVGLNIYLEDKIHNTFTKLDSNSVEYSVIYSKEMKEKDNFFIHTKSKVLTSASNSFKKAAIFNVENELFINGITNKNLKLEMYSLLGKKVFQKSFSSNGASSIQLPVFPAGVYMVKIKNTNAEFTKKIILK